MKGKQKISGSSLADNDQIMDQPKHQVSLAEFQKSTVPRRRSSNLSQWRWTSIVLSMNSAPHTS